MSGVEESEFGHWGVGFLSLNARAGTKDWLDAWFLGGWLIEAHLGLNDDGRGTITPRLPPRRVPCAHVWVRVCLRAADWRSTNCTLFIHAVVPFGDLRRQPKVPSFTWRHFYPDTGASRFLCVSSKRPVSFW